MSQGTSENIVALDLSEDVATLLKKGTATDHFRIGKSKGATMLTRGELDKMEYIRFLIMLWPIYTALEEVLEQHSSNPVLAPTYNPTILSRTTALSSDIAHLLSTSESSWQQHPAAVSVFRNIPKPLTDYIARIHAIARSETSLLLAHAYVRYLGDLSGGQIIRRNIAKAYNLDKTSGLGTQVYTFRKLASAGIATKQDVQKIKEWYRDGLNAGVGNDKELKVGIIEEAHVVYRLNEALFALLRPPLLTSKKENVSTVLTRKTFLSHLNHRYRNIYLALFIILLAHLSEKNLLINQVKVIGSAK